MRNGQNKRMRGRNRNKGQSPLTRVYESNGPDVKIRGTASHVAEKYVQLARDAQSSGDPVSAENYYQHAEHYFRMIAAAQEQFRQSNPYYRPEGQQPHQQQQGNYDNVDDDLGDDSVSGEPGYAPREPQHPQQQGQPYPMREPQPYGQQGQHGQHGQRDHNQQYRPQHNQPGPDGGNVDRLPSFITGGAPQPQQSHQSYGANGGQDNQSDRFPLHRRRRRHRGPRGDFGNNPQQNVGGGGGGDGDDSPRSND
jgi:hypothetical protein